MLKNPFIPTFYNPSLEESIFYGDYNVPFIDRNLVERAEVIAREYLFQENIQRRNNKTMKIMIKTKEWYESEIAYEKHKGIHTYHQCKCKRHATRSGKCWECLEEEMDKLFKGK